MVIPKALREALRLLPNTRLRVVEHEGRIVLEPVEENPVLLERDGLVVCAERAGADVIVTADVADFERLIGDAGPRVVAVDTSPETVTRPAAR